MIGMVIREYPENIKELMKIVEPYENRAKDGVLKDAPQEVIEAFEKIKESFYLEGQ